MINSLDKIIILRYYSQLFILIMTCFFAQNVLANPIKDTLNIPSETSTIQENLDLPNEFISETPDLTSSDLLQNSENLVNKGNKEQEISNIIDGKVQRKQTKSCSTFTSLTNTIKPNISPDDNKENKIEPTSACAADLMGEPNSQEAINKEPENPLMVQETVPEPLPDLSIQTVVDDDRWHFKLQPYATVPINTYGTVSARGETVSYHLTLAEVLDVLRVTASGRFEGWKGRWGFIVDGYFVSLKDIGDLKIARSRTPNPINTLNFLLNRSVNSKVQEVVNVLDREVQAARKIEELRDNGSFEKLDQRLQGFREIVAQDAQRLRELQSNLQAFKEIVVKDGQRLEVIALKVEELQDLRLQVEALQDVRLRVEELRDLGPNIDGLPDLDINTEQLKRILALRIQDLPIIDKLEELNNRIRESNRLTDLREIREKFTQARDILEEANQRIQELRDKKDSEEFRNLQARIQDVKALLDREIQAIQNFQEFQANQEPQQFNAGVGATLQFDQGIYDFALSYHIGDLPSHELPDKPSNRNFPLIWFQPIAGVRLNDITIDIQTITNFQLSTSLVNIQGTVQQNFTSDRTWFEPLLGGKFGIQISDPITFWLRGDASGFGLAGETDISWNLLFGVDWWVHRQISLQLGYRFYEIDYGNSNDNGNFGFEQNLNGPFLSATFHF